MTIQQMTLFSEEDDRPKFIHRRSFEPEVELIPCPVCNQLPRIWTSKTTGGKCAKCESCGYMVHDLYDINEHWYNCNVSRMWRINHGMATDVDHPFRKGKA